MPCLSSVDGARRRRVDHIGAAVFLAHALIRSTHVEKDLAACPAGVSSAQQSFGRKIDEHDRDTPVRECSGGRRGIVAFLQLHLVEREMLVEEFAGGIVVINGCLADAFRIIARSTLRHITANEIMVRRRARSWQRN